jgi:signal transduction histidine kinase
LSFAMFKALRTSTKLLLLCGVFLVSIMVATYDLIVEKRATIEFARKELVGLRYLEALRGVYAAILTQDRDSSPNAQTETAINKSLDTLFSAQADTAGSLDITKPEQALAASLHALSHSKGSGTQKQQLIIDALAKARDLASRIADDSNLTLDPDLDSYYLQTIVVARIPTLLGQVAELQQSLLRVALRGDASSSHPMEHPLIMRGKVRSTLNGIQRSLAAAYRGSADDHLRQTIDASMTSMISAAGFYLKTVNASHGEASDLASFAQAHATAVEGTMSAWAVSQAELKRLLNRRLSSLVTQLRSGFILNGLLAILSLALAVITYRQIMGPLTHLEGLARKVQKTKDFDLRSTYTGRDEIGQLGSAFNAMLAELAEAREREAAEQARNANLQAELGRVGRLNTVGLMAASIAHEINQPLAAVVTNANAGLRWLSHQPPNMEEVRTVLHRIADDGERGGNVIESIRTMLKKDDQERTQLDINDLILEVMTLIQAELKNQGGSISAELADDLPRVLADRIQLQQVVLNLMINGIEAMTSVSDRPRLLQVRSERHESGGVLVTVEDSGAGIDVKDIDRIFETFFTTKPQGMGMGLSICRSIVEAHGGRISASRANPHGSVFQVFLPIGEPSERS